MKLTEKATEGLLDQYAKLVSGAQVKRLRELGHDFIEVGRDGPYLIASDGRRFLDCHCAAGVYNLGRRNEEVAQALHQALAATDQGNFPMISKEKMELAERLAEFIPGKLECSFFSVVRGETFELACKLSRGFTGKKKLLAVEGCRFGQTSFAMSLSGGPEFENYAPLIPQTELLPFGDLEAAAQTIDKNTAAVFLEPVQAENDCRVLEASYLQALREICDRTGALLVIDETQTGLGRTGRRFAYQEAGIEPDILIIGEALGGGMFPIAATVYTQRINSFMNEHPLIHLSTFGGSDLGCMVAKRALEVYEKEKPWANAAKCGIQLKTGLVALIGQGPIQAVNGAGLLLSLDLGNPEKATAFCRALAAEGVLAVPGELAKGSVVLRPALTIGDPEVKLLLQAVAAAVKVA